MKKFFLPIILCAVLLLFSGCRVSENKVSPPFFKITDPESGGVVYLLGTMHVGVKNTVYPSEVYDALDECKTLAVEIDLQKLEADQKRLSGALSLLECKDGSAGDILGDDHEEIRAYFREKGLNSAAYEKYIPAMWSAALSNVLADDCGYEAKYGTDRAMLTYAKKKKFEIIELETIEEQYSINAAEPMKLQIYSLLQSVRTDYETQKEQMHELYTAWSTGDGAALERMLDEDIPKELADEYAVYYDAMYSERQRQMAGYIESVLREGKKEFVAVGALHCYAEPDILDFLENRGFEVTEY